MALAWLFEREDPAEADLAARALSLVAENETLVPMLWHIEVANGLLVGERRGFVTEARTFDYLVRLKRLPIETDDTEPEVRREGIMALARQYGLTAYDATYLDLALRSDAMLATFDRKLAAAAERAGVIGLG